MDHEPRHVKHLLSLQEESNIRTSVLVAVFGLLILPIVAVAKTLPFPEVTPEPSYTLPLFLTWFFVLGLLASSMYYLGSVRLWQSHIDLAFEALAKGSGGLGLSLLAISFTFDSYAPGVRVVASAVSGSIFLLLAFSYWNASKSEVKRVSPIVVLMIFSFVVLAVAFALGRSVGFLPSVAGSISSSDGLTGVRDPYDILRSYGELVYVMMLSAGSAFFLWNGRNASVREGSLRAKVTLSLGFALIGSAFAALSIVIKDYYTGGILKVLASVLFATVCFAVSSLYFIGSREGNKSYSKWVLGLSLLLVIGIGLLLLLVAFVFYELL